jgi:hypothetical protein
MAGPLPAIIAGVSLLAKQLVKRKAHKELVKKRVKDAESRVNVARTLDERKHGPQDITGMVKSLNDPKSETYKMFNKLSTFKGKAKPNSKSPWKK